MSRSGRQFLEGLPTDTVEDQFTLAHGSPRQPVWEYILDPLIAQRNFAYFDTPYCLVGHTHIPVVFHQVDDSPNGCKAYLAPRNEPMSLEVEGRLILNPGSVGQPRDGNPDASYAILDTDAMTWEQRRVAYDVERTQERMRASQLPSRLIDRLEYGR